MENDNYFKKGKYTIITEDIKYIGIDSVYEAFVEETGKQYLCKLINLKSFKNRQNIFEELEETIQIHNQIENEDIDKLIEYIKGSTNLYLFFDYMNGKTLYNYKKEKKVMKEEEIYIILDKIIDAILYLYQNDIILKDLKLENIFICKNGKILLCNLEKRNLLLRNNKEYKLKNAYLKISLRIGMILCKLIDFENFFNYSKKKDIKNLKEKDISLIHEYFNQYIITKENISDQLKDLISELLKEENERFNIKYIKSHEWFQLFSANEDNNKINKPYKKKKSLSKSVIEPNNIELKISQKSTINLNNSNVSKSIADESYISYASTIKNNSNINNTKNDSKKVIEETIVTDEPYLEYYKKEREVLLGLIDSFDKDEIMKNVKLAEKYAEEREKNKKAKKNIIFNYDNSITDDENEIHNNTNNKGKKGKKTGFFSMFLCQGN